MQPALRHLVASAHRQALDGFEDGRVEPQQLQDVADVARAEAGEPREVIARPRFTAIQDALPASRELENANDSRQFRRLGRWRFGALRGVRKREAQVLASVAIGAQKVSWSSGRNGGCGVCCY